MQPDENTFVGSLRHLALSELGLDKDPNCRMVIDLDNGDLLWMNQHGSYRRLRNSEHTDSTAFAVLGYLAVAAPFHATLTTRQPKPQR